MKLLNVTTISFFTLKMVMRMKIEMKGGGVRMGRDGGYWIKIYSSKLVKKINGSHIYSFSSNLLVFYKRRMVQ